MKQMLANPWQIAPAFITTLFIATSLANPCITPLRVPYCRDTNLALEPFIALPVLPASPPSFHGGSDFQVFVGTTDTCQNGTFFCPPNWRCTDGVLRWQWVLSAWLLLLWGCIPNGGVPCGTGHYCNPGNYCYPNGCIPNGGTPCGTGHYSTPTTTLLLQLFHRCRSFGGLCLCRLHRLFHLYQNFSMWSYAQLSRFDDLFRGSNRTGSFSDLAMRSSSIVILVLLSVL
ncbi:uncharacterized protein EI90DRAFT_555598 [Cantharellus anzutake]|uniref:uncharacterized protein n=1 Tax=Cantharellus anzutake TaxID=1750568 RepID=UPI001903B733|nr:uncharacterized protein EI90DRAFT_555598 [Cantharellus anzutake]KAF8313356.1 hypothetical protein EI90DRAFT_555598 [Cantharellus anzutake]